MNEFESEPGFLERFREFYISKGHLTAEQFDDAARKAKEVQALNLLPGVYWGVTPQLTSTYPKLLTSTKLAAQAAGFKEPFTTLGAYVTGYPSNLLKRTTWPSVAKPRPNQKIGSLFYDLGLITRAQLAQTLGLQQLIRDETGTTARFGVLVMRVAGVSLVDLLQVVGFQVGIPFETVDQFVTAYEKHFNTSACP